MSDFTQQFPRLCAPLRLGRRVLRNRICSAPMGFPDLTEDGCLTEGNNIIDGIKIRINALRSSDLQQVQKNKLIQEARTFVDMFENEGIVRYVAISSMLS